MQYADAVLPIMRQMRGTLLSGFGISQPVNQKTDSAWSIVTQVDLDVERVVRGELAKQFSNIEFVGEEGGGDRMQERYWLMDPIDGTLHYARGLPFCTSMLALVERDHVVFGAIYDFLRDDMYWAEQGRGAWCNETQLSVSMRGLREGLVGWESMRQTTQDLEIDAELKKRTSHFKCVVAGWEYAMVAAGKLEGRICFNPFGNDYDYAPGSLLVSEAGGVVANIGARTYNLKNLNFIATNRVIFEELTVGEGALFPID